jgi:hypothetical protein
LLTLLLVLSLLSFAIFAVLATLAALALLNALTTPASTVRACCCCSCAVNLRIFPYPELAYTSALCSRLCFLLIHLSALTLTGRMVLQTRNPNMEHQILSFSTTLSAALQIAQFVRLCMLSYVSKFGAI